jgi:hypothetical protein
MLRHIVAQWEGVAQWETRYKFKKIIKLLYKVRTFLPLIHLTHTFDFYKDTN